MTTVLLVDDHTILRDGIRRGLEAAAVTVVGDADNGEDGVRLALDLRPDVVLMDLSMPVLDGVAATKRITETNPEISVVVLTMHDDPSRTLAALEAGAVGYLTKGTSMAEVIEVVEAVAEGETRLSRELANSMLHTSQQAMLTAALLSDRQTEILQGIADGLSTKQVARALGITQKTVHNHLHAIYQRLDTQSLTHAVLSAVRLGIIDLGVGDR